MDDSAKREQPTEKTMIPDGVSEELPDESRLIRAVQAYLNEVEQGRYPTRPEWLARYPDLSPALGDCLDGLGFMRDAATSLNAGRWASGCAAEGIRPGVPIGDFQIVREIGRGGMGIIYEAIQLSLDRRVALKVLPFVAGLDERILQRFRLESQAAAQLHHSNIVPVFGIGCDRGIHFFAMQLIEGVSLDHVIRLLRQESTPSPTGTPITELATTTVQTAHHLDRSSQRDEIPVEPQTSAQEQPATTGDHADATMEQTLASLSGDLSTQQTRNRATVYRAMARLVVQAAEALDYAHRQGIIHRDIKPANLLVDKSGHLWITDFGFAHLHDDQNLTRSGELLGTTLYASPEQISGHRVVLDQRTDLYSLGATFYELLTREPVFSGATRQALLHQVLTDEPVRPRAIDHSIPLELETIVLKLLSKAPADRYASAGDLAADLSRFLRDEPIAARPPTLCERVRKWNRRHPAYVAASVTVMFVVLVISGISNWLVARANSLTRTALLAERMRAEEAESRFAQARQAVDLLVDLSEHDLAKPPLQRLQKQVLENALEFYQDFVSQYRGNPSREAELVVVEKRLQKVLDDLLVMEGSGQLLLLAEKDVQVDLGISEVARQRVERLAQQFSEQLLELLQGNRQLPPDERREYFLEFARSNEREMRTMLNEDQIRRLEEIRMQLVGFSIFNEPKIIKELEITQSQREAMRQIEAETFLLLDEGKRPTSESAGMRAACFSPRWTSAWPCFHRVS